MKKIFVSLGIVALVAALGIAIVFAYGSYKDLELKKEETKIAEEKEKKAKEKQKKKEQEDDENNTEAVNSEESNTQEAYDQTQNDTTAAPVKETQPAQNQNNNNQASSKNTSESPSSSYDPDAEYAKQKEMYEKAARGEIPEPGADISGDNSQLMERDPSTLTNDEVEQRDRRTNAMEAESQ
ncbi:hypothetical protein [Staphylococcus simulans]|uniref:hypothetical protein n=1 Tax=Staphylococcus simulans TaxID=1286 RepID=UPI0015FA6C09|nr:hypothetical protein [Staphylococcus simulans]